MNDCSSSGKLRPSIVEQYSERLESGKMLTLFKVTSLLVLIFVNLLNYMDRYTIAGSVFPHSLRVTVYCSCSVAGILTQLEDKNSNNFSVQLTDTEGGLLQTSFIISFMGLSPIFGYLGDRYTRKYLIMVGLSLWSAFVLLGSFSVVSIPQYCYTTLSEQIDSILKTELWNVVGHSCIGWCWRG